MRRFFLAIGLVGLSAATSVAQLLGDANSNAEEDPPADAPVPGRPAAGAKSNADIKRPGNAALAGPAAPRAGAIFATIDVDSDGVISKTELRKAIKALRTLDTDNDGSITLAEASVGAAPVGPGGLTGPGGQLPEDPQIAQLMTMDRNNDGRLTANEVPAEMRQMLRGVDQNNDGITRQELAAAMATMRNQFGIAAGPLPGGPAGGLRNEQQATGQFLRYDTDGNGKLSEAELPPQAKRLLRDGDSNKDGSLDAGELQAAMAQLGGKARALRGGVDPDELRGRKNLPR